MLLTAEQLRGVATCGYHVTQPRHVTPSLHRLSTGLSKVPVLAHLESNANLIAETPEAKWRNCCGYPMTDPTGAAIYGVPWIPSIYPSHVSIYTSTMDPMGMEFSPVVTVEVCHGKPACRKVTSSNKVGHFIENSVCVHNRKRVTVKMGRLIQPSINDG